MEVFELLNEYKNRSFRFDNEEMAREIVDDIINYLKENLKGEEEHELYTE